MNSPSPHRRSPMIVALGILAAVWTAWLLLAEAPLATLARHWGVAVTMVLGSVIAGSTCEGGGAVAFPVLTKAMAIEPQVARSFSLAIQSVGMTAAAVSILLFRVRIDLRAIGVSLIGAAPGLLIGMSWLAPAVSPPVVKLLFTMLQCGIAFTLIRVRWFASQGAVASRVERRWPESFWILAATGFLGGLVSSLFGNGADLLLFSMLVLLFRVDERVATPTTVVLMAVLSCLGWAVIGWRGEWTPELRGYWTAATPVVVLGAPIGAWLCQRLSAAAIVRVLLALIAVEVATTFWLIPLNGVLAATAIGAGLAFTAGYAAISRWRRYWPHPEPAAMAGAEH